MLGEERQKKREREAISRNGKHERGACPWRECLSVLCVVFTRVIIVPAKTRMAPYPSGLVSAFHAPRLEVVSIVILTSVSIRDTPQVIASPPVMRPDLPSRFVLVGCPRDRDEGKSWHRLGFKALDSQTNDDQAPALSRMLLCRPSFNARLDRISS